MSIESRKIKSALISVYCKDHLAPIIKLLAANGIKLYSTGGTLDFINSLNVEAQSIESLTGYPSILGGRVKTLHPKVFGGILARRGLDIDVQHLEEHQIPTIDLVIVDLYPFEETLASGASDVDVIEKIDIGGISLIRAAAKNFNDVLIVPSRKHYTELMTLLENQQCSSTLSDRKRFAGYSFMLSSAYDHAISNFFTAETSFNTQISPVTHLRYGENPHQKGRFYGNLSAIFSQINGKEISYNNLLDIDAALALIADFDTPTFAILKHNNACGCATSVDILSAWHKALAGDPVSAFGGVLVSNQAIDAACAEEMNKLFFEIVLAPKYSPEALAILKTKKNRIILETKINKVIQATSQFRSLLNGVLVQDKDLVNEQAIDLKTVTVVQATKEQVSDLLFANILVKHSKSNAIVLALNGQLIASGVGQTSRIDALKHAIEKAASFGFSLKGAVMASDAFFPFADCIKIAAEAGIQSVIQPGGSINDKDSIALCNELGLSMVTTGNRHFKH